MVCIILHQASMEKSLTPMGCGPAGPLCQTGPTVPSLPYLDQKGSLQGVSPMSRIEVEVLRCLGSDSRVLTCSHRRL